MSKVLLIHGAWHNESCWEGVFNKLTNEGYEVEAISLPGNGIKDSKDVTYNDYVTCISDAISKEREPVTVVGHSSAGHVIQMSIPKVADKVKKVIFNNAWILPHGLSQFDLVPPEIKDGMTAAAKASGENAIPIDPGFVRGMLTTKADDDTHNKLMDILVTQPMTMMETKVDAESFAKIDIPKVLLHCADDVSLPPNTYVNMFKALGDYPVIDIPCDHEGLFTDSKVYAEGLIECIEI